MARTHPNDHAGHEQESALRPIRLRPDDSPESTPHRPDKWSEMRARTLTDPASRERYQKKFDSIVAIRRMLQIIDAERERVGLSKSDLARKIGASPATVRRLFTSPTSNPTLRTVLDLLTALDLGIEVEPHHPKTQHVDAQETSGTLARSSADRR